MTYIKGSHAHHTPSDEPAGDPNRTCLYDGESWPCDAESLRREVQDATVAEVLEAIRPQGSEPLCCDLHAAIHVSRVDLRDELELWAQMKREARR